MALTRLDMEELAEGTDLEVKKATGRDGQGEIGRSFFESYVAMANTYGGHIFLGIQEKPKGTFQVVGVGNPDALLKILWDSLNDRDQVSINLLTSPMVDVIDVSGRTVISVNVPRARRTQRPVHIGSNPLKGTYRRDHEGDYLCDEETVRRIMAERVEQARDAQVVEGTNLADVDEDTLRAFRNVFAATRPDHPFLGRSGTEFLRVIGAWTRDKQSGKEGLTLAGLLMFGQLRSILDEVPYFVIDYQEQISESSESRWIDRITTDGTWSGNLYDFYRRTIQSLIRDLKIPFRLVGLQRIDDTPVHEALREALVNTLIHADFTGRVPIRVVKRPDLFEFRNPGIMRVPLNEAIAGGMSDCRNRNLQKLFQFVGLGEQAGSGLPRIYGNWKQQHWRAPELSESVEPEHTVLTLRMVSLLPEETLAGLDMRFGPSFRELPEIQRLALATVSIEGHVTHARLRSMATSHPHDISVALASLVRAGYLSSFGATRSTVYYFPDEVPDTSHASFNVEQTDFKPPSNQIGLFDEHDLNEQGSNTASTLAQRRDARLQHSPTPSQHNSFDEATSIRLQRIASHVSDKLRTPKTFVEQTIIELCRGHFLTLEELATLLNRTPDTLRNHYVSQLVRNGILELRYPNAPHHPAQSYRTTEPL